MKKQNRILVVGLLAVLALTGTLRAQRLTDAGELRGTFVRLTEQRVGERGYMGVVIRPPEKDEHVTVLLSRHQEELAARVRRLRPGQRMAVAYVTEDGRRWLKELEADRQGESRRPPEGPRVQPGIRELLERMERMERSLRELREEIERLRAELRETRGRNMEVKRESRRTGQDHQHHGQNAGRKIEIKREIRRSAENDEHHGHDGDQEIKLRREIHSHSAGDEHAEHTDRDGVEQRSKRQVKRRVGQRSDRQQIQ